MNIFIKHCLESQAYYKPRCMCKYVLDARSQHKDHFNFINLEKKKLRRERTTSSSLVCVTLNQSD